MKEIKKIIYCPTKLRSFQNELLSNLKNKYEIIREKNFYDKITIQKKILSKIARSKIFDILGIIQVLKIKRECDLVYSYNRFIKNKDYIINLENPTALYHYSLDRRKSFLGKLVLKKQLNTSHLKKIVCLSKICYNTSSILLNEEVKKEKIIQIYPYIENENINIDELEKKSSVKKIGLLFISSDFYLKSGGEILSAFKKIENIDLKLDIVTDISKLKRQDLNYIKRCSNINLFDFNLKKEELKKLYRKNNILLHPTRQDSLPLVVLEAIKFGLPIISTNVYAIPEIVTDNENGFLTNTRYNFFERDGIPNPKVWNNRKKTIYSEYIDDKIVDFLIKTIKKYYNDRKLLFEHSKNSYFRSINENFSSVNIKNKWLSLLEEIVE